MHFSPMFMWKSLAGNRAWYNRSFVAFWPMIAMLVGLVPQRAAQQGSGGELLLLKVGWALEIV